MKKSKPLFLLLFLLFATTAIAQKIPVTTNSKAALALYEKGMHLMDQHLHKESAEAFRQACTIDPDFALARTLFVWHSHALGTPVNTTAELNKAVETAHKTIPGEQKLVAATKAEYSGNMQEARRLLEELEKEYPDDVHVRVHLGVLYYFGFQKYALAEAMFREGVRRHPDKIQFLNNLGYALMAQGKYKEAEEVLKKAVENEPGQANAYDSLGDLYAAMQQYDQAIEQYTISIALNSNLSKNNLNQAKINKAKQSFQNVTDLKDSASVTNLFTSTAMVLSPERKTYKGENEVAQYWQAEASKGATSLNFKSDETRFGDDWLYELGKYTRSNPKGKNAAKEGNYMVLWKSTPTGWRIDQMILN